MNQILQQESNPELKAVVIKIPKALDIKSKRFERAITSFKISLQEQCIPVEIHADSGMAFCVKKYQTSQSSEL